MKCKNRTLDARMDIKSETFLFPLHRWSNFSLKNSFLKFFLKANLSFLITAKSFAKSCSVALRNRKVGPMIVCSLVPESGEYEVSFGGTAEPWKTRFWNATLPQNKGFVRPQPESFGPALPLRRGGNSVYFRVFLRPGTAYSDAPEPAHDRRARLGFRLSYSLGAATVGIQVRATGLYG